MHHKEHYRQAKKLFEKYLSKSEVGHMSSLPNPAIGYIMKGYPRLSEPFISNEIYLLERMGLTIHIFAVKSSTEAKVHSLVHNIHAEVAYLPEVPCKSDFWVWFRKNFPHFIGSHRRLFMLRPLSYIQTLGYTLSLSFKYRSSLIPTWRSLKKVFFKDFLRAGYIALKVLESGRIRHLHGHFCHGSTTMTMFVSRLSGLPFSFTAHAKDIYLPQLNPGDLLQTKIQKAQFVVTCTDTNRTHLEQLCPASTPIRTIYHGLDTARFRPVEPRTNSHNLPVLLSVGRCVEKKGFPYLIQACRLLKDKGYTFQCRIVGEAAEQTELVTQLIKELQLEDTVLLRDAVTQDELRQIYRESTVFVLPCQIVDNGDRDGIPNVLVEAMAMAIPVVSTDVSGIPELIQHRTNGLLVPQKNARAVAEACEELLRDILLRQRLGKAARETVCRVFDSNTTTRELKNLFSECLEMSAGAVA